MRLIVGLGNPGLEYERTPHNLGFCVVSRLAQLARIRKQEHRAESALWRVRLDGQEVLLAQPLTYMNLSGVAVRKLLLREQTSPADLIVVTDDVALPRGMIRIRERGSAGGHNGLDSVVQKLGTQEFLRVRLGVQPAGPVEEMADYLLTAWGEEEWRKAEEMIREGAEAVRAILREGPQRAMTRFNRRVRPPEGKEETLL